VPCAPLPAGGTPGPTGGIRAYASMDGTESDTRRLRNRNGQMCRSVMRFSLLVVLLGAPNRVFHATSSSTCRRLHNDDVYNRPSIRSHAAARKLEGDPDETIV